jgi:hypothetical protein
VIEETMAISSFPTASLVVASTISSFPTACRESVHSISSFPTATLTEEISSAQTERSILKIRLLTKLTKVSLEEIEGLTEDRALLLWALKLRFVLMPAHFQALERPPEDDPDADRIVPVDAA